MGDNDTRSGAKSLSGEKNQQKILPFLGKVFLGCSHYGTHQCRAMITMERSRTSAVTEVRSPASPQTQQHEPAEMQDQQGQVRILAKHGVETLSQISGPSHGNEFRRSSKDQFGRRQLR